MSVQPQASVQRSGDNFDLLKMLESDPQHVTVRLRELQPSMVNRSNGH